MSDCCCCNDWNVYLLADLHDLVVACDVVIGVLCVGKEELVGWAETIDRYVLAQGYVGLALIPW